MTPEERAEKELAEELGFDRDALGVMLATEDGFIMEFDVASIKRLWSLALRQRVELNALNKRTAEGVPTERKHEEGSSH